jgi:hypothetical protein
VLALAESKSSLWVKDQLTIVPVREKIVRFVSKKEAFVGINVENHHRGKVKEFSPPSGT